jgi:hypothetical protein
MTKGVRRKGMTAAACESVNGIALSLALEISLRSDTIPLNRWRNESTNATCCPRVSDPADRCRVIRILQGINVLRGSFMTG